MATHSSVLAWRIPGTGEPGGPPSLGSHRVGHDWSDLEAAAAVVRIIHLLCHLATNYQVSLFPQEWKLSAAHLGRCLLTHNPLLPFWDAASFLESLELEPICHVHLSLRHQSQETLQWLTSFCHQINHSLGKLAKKKKKLFYWPPVVLPDVTSKITSFLSYFSFGSRLWKSWKGRKISISVYSFQVCCYYLNLDKRFANINKISN